MKKNLYNYAVLFHERDAKGNYVNTTVILEPKTMLAKSDKEVAFKATREIPESYTNNPEDVEIVISPF